MNENPNTPDLYVRTIADIKSKYSQDDFLTFGANANKELRYKALSALFSNLHGKKILYCERLVLSLVEIKEIEVTEERFSIQIERTQLVNDGRTREEGTIAKKTHWTFGARWDFLCFDFKNDIFGAPYAGWRIWIDPDLIEKTEMLLRENKIEEILESTIYKKSNGKEQCFNECNRKNA